MSDSVNSLARCCCRLNSYIVRFLERSKKNSPSLRNGAANNAELDDGCDATAVLLKKCKPELFLPLTCCGLLDVALFHVSISRLCVFPSANHHRKTSVLMVDELLSAYPHQLTFSEAGMRIMITSHFSPRTRLTMASRMLITEVKTLTGAAAQILIGKKIAAITNSTQSRSVCLSEREKQS